MSKYTPWFPGTVKPVHVGVYQRRYGEFDGGACVRYAKWDGEQWSIAADTPRTAEWQSCCSLNQLGKWAPNWRGLSKPA